MFGLGQLAAYFGWLAFAVGLFVISDYNYLLFHFLAEIFSVIIASGIFIIVWNSRRIISNDYLAFIGVAFLFIAGLDMIHVLTYRGMSVVRVSGSNVPTQLWLAARFLESMTFLLAPLFLSKKIRERLNVNINLAVVAYSAVALFLLLSILYWNIFPAAYIEGVGLTPFKKITEYVISFILAVSLYLLFRKKSEFTPVVFWFLVSAVTSTIISELSFTLYIDPYGFFNKLGHFLKIFAFYCIYQAVVVSSLADPFSSLFKNLTKKEEALSLALEKSDEAAKSLADSEKLYQEALIYTQSVVETTPNPLVILNEKLRVEMANKSFYDFFQTTPEEIGKRLFYELGKKEWDIPELNFMLRAALSNGEKVATYEMDANFSKIGHKTLIIFANRIKRPGDHPPLILLSINDLTEEKKLRDSLESERDFKSAVLDSGQAFVVVLDCDGEVIQANKAFVRFTGYSLEEIKSKYFWDVFRLSEKEKESMRKEYLENLKLENFPITLETNWKIKDGSRSLIRWASAVMLDKRGNIEYVVNTGIDLTKMKQVEQEFEAIIRTAINSFWITDIEGNFLDVNKAYCSLTGYSRRELLSMKISDVEAKETVAETKRHIQKIVEAGSGRFESEHRCKDGKIISLDISINYLDIKGGRMFVFLRDITERKRAEEKLKEYAKQTEREKAEDEAILSSVGDGLVATNKEEKILFVNQAFEALTGKKSDQLIGRKLTRVIPFSDEKGNSIPPEKRPVPMALATGKKVSIGVNFPISYCLEREGVKIPLAITATPIILENKITGAIGVWRDITEEKRVDRAKSEFISLAAHQLRTPLATISLTSEMLNRGVAGKIDKDSREHLDSIQEEIKAMSEMIETFLNVSRIEMGTFPIEPKPVNLIRTMDDILNNILPQIKNKGLRLSKDYVANLPAINLDQKVMKIVFQNLLSNAIKYTPSGGLISVGIKRVGQEIVIKITDSGVGVPKDQQSRVFEKMYRATNVRDKMAEGAGLGLYVVKSALLQCNCKIWLESRKNKGAAFSVAIPLEGMKKINIATESMIHDCPNCSLKEICPKKGRSGWKC